MQNRNKYIYPRYNNKGQKHGYWKSYWNDGTIYYKCFYVNGIEYGYEEIDCVNVLGIRNINMFYYAR